jgi:paraquat-inducible protein B
VRPRCRFAPTRLRRNPEFKRTLENLNATLAEVRAAVARLDGQIDPAAKELHATLGEARRALQAFGEASAATRGFFATNAGVGAEVGATLLRLNEAADAVARLAEYLERNPNALLLGKKRP